MGVIGAIIEGIVNALFVLIGLPLSIIGFFLAGFGFVRGDIVVALIGLIFFIVGMGMAAAKYRR